MEIKDEQWKCIPEYPNVEISDTGLVRSRRTKKLIEQRITHKGYPSVSIKNSQGIYKSRVVHRLVAYAFIHNPLLKATVNHKDLNKTNNHISNLEWMSVKENVRHAWDSGHRGFNGQRMSGPEASEVLKKKVLFDNTSVFDSVTDLAKFLGVQQASVSHALKRTGRIKGRSVKLIPAGLAIDKTSLKN